MMAHQTSSKNSLVDAAERAGTPWHLLLASLLVGCPQETLRSCSAMQRTALIGCEQDLMDHGRQNDWTMMIEQSFPKAWKWCDLTWTASFDLRDQ
jgi:hypothetical protein